MTTLVALWKGKRRYALTRLLSLIAFANTDPGALFVRTYTSYVGVCIVVEHSNHCEWEMEIQLLKRVLNHHGNIRKLKLSSFYILLR
jgi:hypothetical protein